MCEYTVTFAATVMDVLSKSLKKQKQFIGHLLGRMEIGVGATIEWYQITKLVKKMFLQTFHSTRMPILPYLFSVVPFKMYYTNEINNLEM